jgi:D-glycero-D-manno-heptose 1,7-bisphosphate phosphatase
VVTAAVPPDPAPTAVAARPFPVVAILFDRDGTLVEDLPGNRDPALLVPMPTAATALALAGRSGVRTGVVTNQPGIGRGTLAWDDLAALHGRVDQLLGPFDVWEVCPHPADAGCGCRKPEPGLLLAAAARLGVAPRDCVCIGDIASDVEAARRAGMPAILVPTAVTHPRDVAAAPVVARTLLEAVRLALGSATAGAPVVG